MNISEFHELFCFLQSKGAVVELSCDGSSCCDYLFHLSHQKENEWTVYNWEFAEKDIIFVKMNFSGIYIEVEKIKEI